MLPSETLLLIDRVRNTIALGEGQFREFKSALHGPPNNKKPRGVGSICDDIAEGLVAFANADGGELLVGVEDNGEPTGVLHSAEDIARMLNSAATHVHPKTTLPMIAATELTLDFKKILFFSVAKGTTGIFQLNDGRCMRRVEKSTVPEHVEQLTFERQEVHSRAFDRNYVDGAKVTDLDLDLLNTIAQEYINGLSAERYLQQIGLAEYAPGGLRLRMASLLLFAKNVSQWHPRSQVRILKVAGTELKVGGSYNVQSDEVVTGNIFSLLVKSWEIMRPFLAYKTEFGASGTFEQKYIYPELACREALVNAIAHRDYSVFNGIDVFVFDDRMEFRNPGALLSTLRLAELESLQGAHESRNSLISKVLRENRIMRELGEGMKRIYELMTANELQQPTLQSDSSAFSITLPHRSVFSGLQEQWLLMFQQFDLSPAQKKILILGMNGREISPADIFKAINTTDRNVYDSEVTGLRKSRVLLELRTNVQSTRYARAHKIGKAEVPRFKVQIPGLPPIPETHDVGKHLTPIDSAIKGKRRKDVARQVFVSNISRATTADDLSALFRPYQVVSVKVPSHNSSGKAQNKGFAFVELTDAANVQSAINRLNGHVLAGNMLTIRAMR